MSIINAKFQEQVFENKFKELINEVTLRESRRLGFPVSGGILRGKFSEDSWIPNLKDNYIVDISKLGLLDNTPATLYLNNAGSPFEYCNSVSHHSKSVESLLLYKIAIYFGATNPSDLFGYVTSGGSEGNLSSLWWHREYFLKQVSAEQQPVLLVSDQVHHSIIKSANILNYKLEIVDSHKSLGININSLKEMLIKKLKLGIKNVVICVNIGTTKEGCIDDLKSIKNLCDDLTSQGLIYRIHADAAIYGVILPIINPTIQIFDLVDSISFSGHKFVGTFSICGIVFAKQEILKNGIRKSIDCDIAYLGDISDLAINCSRSGFAPIELYSVLETLDVFKNKNKITKLYRACKNNADYLTDKLSFLLGEENVFNNYITVNFIKPKSNYKAEYIAKKYSLMTSSEDYFVAKIFPHISIQLLNEFITEYTKLFKKVNV